MGAGRREITATSGDTRNHHRHKQCMEHALTTLTLYGAFTTRGPARPRFTIAHVAAHARKRLNDQR
eukprot:2192544-Prymnesium_polylepis.1